MKVKFLSTAWTWLKTSAKMVPTVIKANSPAVLAGTAIVGAVAIAYTAYKCAPKCKEAIEEESKVDSVKTLEDGTEEHTVEHAEPSKKTKAKIFVKTMWPVMVALIVTVTSIVASHKISAKRIAVLSAAYATATQKASEAAEKKAEEFIKAKFGDQASEEYKEEVKKEQELAKKAASNISSKTEIIETGGGNTLFYDYYSGQLFRSSEGYLEAKLQALIADLRLSSECDMMSYNEILDAWGLKQVGLGEYLGFDIAIDAPNLAIITRPIDNNDIIHRDIPCGPEHEAPWILTMNMEPVDMYARH